MTPLDSAPAKRLSHLTHSPIDCHFNASPRDFVVREIPLYEPSGSGEHLFACVRKRGLSTFELISTLASALHCKARDIGYAGLKDKAATTYQFLSFHRSLEGNLTRALPFLESKQIKILSLTPHHNKLKIGHLRGNAFFMRLKKVTPSAASKLHSILQILEKSGFANYFGNQRFGKEGDNFLQGANLAHTPKKRKSKLDNFLISSYQSHLFNRWLNARIELARIVQGFTSSEVLHALSTLPSLAPLRAHLTKPMIQAMQGGAFPLLQGDVMCHYPHGKMYPCEDVEAESARFSAREVAPMGALCGSKLFSARGAAQALEEGFLDSALQAIGSRRYAWVWASEISAHYIEQKAHYELSFTLPKGSYATIFLENLLKQDS